MTVESANYISQLNTSYPATGDARSEGDDHLRLIKTALKQSFPALSSALFTYSGGWSGTHTPTHLTNNTVIYGFTGNGTLALTAAATVGNGFVIGLYVPSGVSVVIDPDGAETINGSGTLSVSDSLTLIFCTGSAWVAFESSGDSRMLGEIVAYAGSSLPAGWLYCDGSAIARSTYASLFTAISTSFGAGDGSTTFNLPDLRGRLPVGRDTMDNSVGTGGGAASRVTTGGSGVDGATLGASGGAQNVTLDVDKMPSHNHGGSASLSGSTATDGGHTHAFTQNTDVGGTNTTVVVSGNAAGSNLTPSQTTGTHSHSLSGGSATIASQGGGQAHNNIPPVQVVNYIIKAF